MDGVRLAELIENPPDGEISMSIEGDGPAILKCGDETFELTEHQASVLFDHGGLMLMQRIRLARQSSATQL